MKIIRKQIIDKLKSALEPNPAIFAMWLEGADSNKAVDKYSDLDIWLDVKDGKEKQIMRLVERILKTLGQLDLVEKLKHPIIEQKVFHLKDSPEFLLLDVCIQKHSRKFKFIREITHELPLVLFDKKFVTKLHSLNKIKTNKEIKNRIVELKNIMSQAARARKYVLRGKFLEALVYYHKWILEPLVEMLRIKYCPLTRDYHLVHVSDHLPASVVKKLDGFYKVKSLNDIAKKTKQAIAWFKKI